MKVVYKYLLPIKDEVTLSLPIGAEMLTVQMQRNELYLWALVDSNPSIVKEQRRLRIAGTGHFLVEGASYEYISTFQLFDGDIVFHVFEIKEKKDGNK